MHRTLLSLVAAASVAATLSAQCIDPALSLQSLQTTMDGNFIYGNLTPPLYGVSQDPGPGYRCDLTVSAPVSITKIGVSLWCDGSSVATIPTTNLIILPGSKIEMWIAPGATVTNAANYAVPYTRVPAAGPDTSIWTLAGTGNMVVSALGVASLATFPTPVALAAGTYAVEMVLVAPYALPAGTDNVRIHPRMLSIPTSGGSLVYEDQYMKIEHSGITSPAFAAGALNHLTAGPQGPFIADIRFDYNVGVTAYSTGYGVGCYDSKKSWYQSFNGAATPAGTQPAVTVATPHIQLVPLGAPVNQYFVQAAAGTYPLQGTPGTSFFYFNQNVNAFNAAVGTSWDDGNSTLYTLPFPLNHPGGTATQISICSNGAVYLGATSGTRFFFDGFAGWLLGPASYAVGFGDLWPADLVTFSGGTGDIFIDSDGATWVAVSWVGVSEYPNGANATVGNTFQVVFNISGIVDYAWQQLANSDSAPMLIGYTPGGAAPDPGSGPAPRSAPNLSVLPFLSGNGNQPPLLTSVNRPVIGTPLILRSSNLDPAVGALLSFISATSLPGIDLGTPPANLGMPGCNANILLPEIANQLSIIGFGVPTFDQNYGVIPPVVLGFSLYAQTAALCAHGAPPLPAGSPFNALDILVTNGVCLHFENN